MKLPAILQCEARTRVLQGIALGAVHGGRESTRGLHLGTTERSFGLAEAGQLGLRLGSVGARRTPQLALGSILLGEQAPQFLEGSAVALDSIEDRVGRGRNTSAFSP